ncbi:hypothetical protein [Nonomuraea solani]|nr:hypothetical protein [Nonomuraea solani]
MALLRGETPVAAQLDQGVRQTLVQRWEPFGPAPCLPIQQSTMGHQS